MGQRPAGYERSEISAGCRNPGGGIAQAMTERASLLTIKPFSNYIPKPEMPLWAEKLGAAFPVLSGCNLLNCMIK